MFKTGYLSMLVIKDVIKIKIGIVLFFMLFSLHVLSQDFDSTRTGIWDLSLEQLMQMKVVSASKVEQKLNETSANVIIITKTDIELSGATCIPDVLRNVAGLDVMSGWDSGIDVGGRGLNQLENSKILVLINGQRVNNDYSGSVRWKEIPVFLENIERIEILTSPLSALYGANAFSATINIITISAGNLKGLYASTRIGEQETQIYHIGYGNKVKKINFRFDIGYGKTEGWGNRDSTKIKDSVMPYKGMSGKIKDWWELSKATFDISYPFSTSSNISLTGGINYGEVATPDLQGTANKMLNTHSLTNNNRLMLKYDKKFQKGSALEAFTSSVHSDYYGGNLHGITGRYDGELMYTNPLGEKNLLVSGIFSEFVTAESPYIDKKRCDNLYGLYLQDEYKPFSKLKITGGLRLDKHTQLDLQLSPRISVNITPWKNNLLRIGVGSAFRKPSFIENYYIKIDTATNSIVEGLLQKVNGSSNPEKILSCNIDYQNIIGKFTTKINLFRNYITDLIGYEKIEPYPPYAFGVLYGNSGKLNVTGGEFELRGKPTDYFQFFVNASYQKIDYKTEVTSEKLSVPEWKGNIGLQTNFKFGVYSSTILHYTGKREAQFGYYPGSGVNYYFMKFDPVSIIDVNVGYRFNLKKANIQFFITCFNIMNKKHIEYAVFDGDSRYFDLNTPATNYNDEQKKEYENRNALHDRKILLGLVFSFN
jgi:outer membrane cobalamin receptor